jgi:hypothetical protein
MHLRANVRRTSGACRHVVAGRFPADVTTTIVWLEIVPADGAWYLFYFNGGGEFVTDGWHESLKEAKDQARFEFEIEDADWHEVA